MQMTIEAVDNASSLASGATRMNGELATCMGSFVQVASSPCNIGNRHRAGAGRAGQYQVIGLTTRPFSQTIRWRWQPVEKPVVPT